MKKFLEAAVIALGGDLGVQAAVVHDRARQHRRGDVDHRRGVADPGAERVGARRDRATRRRRLVQRAAVPDHVQRRGLRSASAATRASPPPTPRAMRTLQPAGRGGDARVAGQRRGHAIATSRSTARRFRGHGGVQRLHDLQRRARAADDARPKSSARRPVVVIGWDIADRLFGADDPLEQDHPDRRRAFPRHRRQRQAGHASSASRRTSSPSFRSASSR